MDDLIKDEQGLIKTGEGTAVNPQFMSAQGLQQAQHYAGNLPTTIGSNVLSGNPAPLNLFVPQTTPSTVGAGIIGATDSKLTIAQNELAKLEANQKATAQSALDTTKTSLYDRILGKKQILEEKATATQTPEFLAKQKSTNDAYSALQSSKQAQANEVQAIKNQPMLTDVQKSQKYNEITNRYALQNANLSVTYDIANRDYISAQNTINQVAQLKMEALQPQIDYYSAFLSSNETNLTNSEKAIIQTKKDELKTMQTNIQSNKDDALKFAQTAITNGQASLGAQIYALAQNSDSPTFVSDLGAYAGQITGDPLDRQTKVQQLENARLQGQKLKQEIDMGQPLTGEFAGIINSAAGLVPGTKKSIVKTNIANAIASQNYVTAYAEIANAVSEGLTGTNKTTFDDARTDIGVMTGMRKAIKDYTDAGGDVGFLKGTADNIAKKFGQLAVDPKFATLGVQLTREFQAYRLAMTGAAFTPEESREYAAVNPRTNATLNLNLATVDGALNQLTNRIVSTINARIPDSQKIYDLAFTKSDATENQTPVGDIQYVGGVKHIKSQDGLYYPENQVKPSGVQTTTSNYSSLNNTNAFSNFGSFFNFK